MPNSTADLDAARSNVEGAEHGVAFVRERLYQAFDRVEQVAANPDRQDWEAGAAATSVDNMGRLLVNHERLLHHHRGVLDALSAE